MRSMQWQLGMLGTVSAFAYRHRETKKNLCRGGRSQELPSTDIQPAVRHLKYIKKQQCTHSITNTHKMTTIHKRTTTIHTRQLQQYKKKTTTIHKRQLQQYTQDNYNNTHKTTTTINTRQLQQYTRPCNNNYTQDNLKLATNARQIRIQHVQKVKTPK